MQRSPVASLAIVALVMFAAAVAGATKPDQQSRAGSLNENVSRVAAKTILSFTTMYGVDGPFLDEANAIRGIPGDELPWEIKGTVRGSLDADGHLTIRVRGLVFTGDDIVPRRLRGTNDESDFRGLVSCVSETEDEGLEEVNVVTDPFPATITGNANIITTVELPKSCIAPIVMVIAGSEDKWFAITGFEADDAEDAPVRQGPN